MGTPERVLHIVSAMDRGGAETLIMNIYRNIDRSTTQFDFITHSNEKGNFDDEIISLGGRIYQIPSLGELGPIRYLKQLIKLMTKENYVAIHSHTDYQGGFPALAAKISGIQKRICHSHSNNWPLGSSLKGLLKLKVLQLLIRATATDFCSCSTEAAAFLFGEKLVRNNKVDILKNGIDIQQFWKMRNCRNSVIQEFNLPKEAKIIGHVGRFSESKNHLFLLKVAKKVIEADPTFVVLLVGDGPLKQHIEEEAKKLNIQKHIWFLGVREDIPRLMNAFDVFLFPSLFEGFGIVTLEAQCTGTPCIVSSSIPKTTDMGLGLISYLNLNEDINVWGQEIINSTQIKGPDAINISKNITSKGFSIQENVSKWLQLYGQSKITPQL
jgi:glycosyltransferase EpsF